MLTPEDRQELINIFSKLKEEVTDTLENDNVLPSSITNNGKQVGIKIELYKIYPEKEVSPPKHQENIGNGNK